MKYQQQWGPNYTVLGRERKEGKKSLTSDKLPH
jgi:hypothetical protein